MFLRGIVYHGAVPILVLIHRLRWARVFGVGLQLLGPPTAFGVGFCGRSVLLTQTNRSGQGVRRRCQHFRPFSLAATLRRTSLQAFSAIFACGRVTGRAKREEIPGQARDEGVKPECYAGAASL